MSRGGRGGANRGRGGRRAGPDIAWDDEPVIPSSTKPEPLFPEAIQSTPKTLSSSERSAVHHYRNFRDAMRNGPLYTILEPTSLTDEHDKVNKRAGFNAFEGMPTYASRYKRPKRTLPDLSGIPYSLDMFPQELWSTIDPKKRNSQWKTALPQYAGESSLTRKRKIQDVDEGEEKDEEDEDIITSGRRKPPKTRDDPTERKGQKQGLEAEDDYGPDQEENGDEEEAGGESEQDSEFSESEDGAYDDYNAENYFDAGEEDEVDDGGGGEEDYL